MSLGRRPEAGGETEHAMIVRLAFTDDPAVPSAAHLLDDVDEVRFGRGRLSVERRREDLQTVLHIRVPDGRMSTDHGRLVRGPAGWVLDDPASKNGVIVDGALTRSTLVSDGALVELGHTLFVLRHATMRAPAGSGFALDVDADTLGVASPALATFVPELSARFADLVRIAPTTVAVVLLGETGTGKEVIARALHDLSRRRGPLVAINCGALPATLIEAELFGHRRGAFSGALTDRPGLVRSADQGTLFLDEVGELPLGSQAAFLRVLQEQEVVPLGGERPIKVDTRVCCATLRDLDALVDQGAFRRDLYARLFGLVVELPPLRERRVDLGILVPRLLARLGAGAGTQLTPAAWRALYRYDWPLNIRELEKALVSALALSGGEPIDLAHLPASVQHGPRPPARAPAPAMSSVAAPAAANEPELDDEDRTLRDGLVTLLSVHRGNVMSVAAAMGKRRSQIYKWARRLNIDLDAYRR
ncbi:MAG: sigma 54-interacting transcriptional regulator [Deltaproteobacteria bacterium]|nr:sigma 54-interacting transcriptional regulator [Kofleriaceae bacterium]